MAANCTDDSRVVDFKHHFCVALHDTDAAGVLFYAHLFRHAHDAYEEWMRLLGHPIDAIIRQGMVGLPVARADAIYRQPMRHGDAICISLGLAELRPHRFTIDYRFLRSSGDLSATARTVHVCIDARKGSVHPLPRDLAETMQSLPRYDRASQP